MGLLKGMLRVYLVALEAKSGGLIPTHHPVMTWLVKHANGSISKYMVGHDGKTPLQRHLGKVAKDEASSLASLCITGKGRVT